MAARERPAQRRRGAGLEAAILEAAWEELTEAGYAALTREGVRRPAQDQPGRAVPAMAEPARARGRGLARPHGLHVPRRRSTPGTLRGDVLALLRHMSARVGEMAGTLSFVIAASFEEAGITPAVLRERAIAGGCRPS